MNYQWSQHKMVTYEIQRLNGPPHRYDLRTGKSLGNVTTTYYICGVQVESRATTKILFFNKNVYILLNFTVNVYQKMDMHIQ
jgi:hypothetical protein